MPLRIVYNNVSNSASSLVASTTAGGLAASNLLTDQKSEVWRSTGNSATLTLTWAASKPISMVSLAFSNLTASATMRVQCYTLSGDASPVFDTGAIACCNVNLGFTSAVGFGGGMYGTVWFSSVTCQKIVITISDASLSYIQAGRLITGNYWTPERDAESDSVKLTYADDSKHSRSEAGGLWTERGPMYKKLTFDLSVMSASDRNAMWRIAAGNGMSNSLFISVHPESTDVWAEQMHTIYGRLTSQSAFQFKYLHLHATQLQVEEV